MAKPEVTATVQLKVKAAGVVRPGDTLVLAVGQDATLESVKEFGAQVEQRLPGVKVLVVNANALAVYRPDGSDAE